MTTKTKPTKTFPVLDADSHVLEPAAVWEKFLEPEYRVLARSSFWHEEGEQGPRTVLNGRPIPELPSPNIPRHAIWRLGMGPADVGELDPKKKHPINPGASDPKARLKDMDAMGVDQALLMPTLFAEYFPVLENPDVAFALARAYNNWVLDFSKAAPERLLPAAVLPLQDVGFAVREARRVAGLGFRAAFIRPVVCNGHYPHQPYYYPLWKELEALNLLACMHPTAGPAAAELQSHSGFVERVSAHLGLGHPLAEVVAPLMDNSTFLTGFLTEALWQTFPKAKVAFLHSGAAWVPLTLEKTEFVLWSSTTAQTGKTYLEPEKLYELRTNFVTFTAGDSSVRRIHATFESLAAWGSRYPNWDAATAWDAIADLESGGVPRATIEKLMGGNALRVLGVQPLKAARAAR